MQLTGSLLSLALFASSALSAPGLLKRLETVDGETTGRYIVKLKDGVDRAASLSAVSGFTSTSEITHEWDLINGFAGTFDEDALNALLADPDVESVSEDGIGSIAAVQTNAPWGLARISRNTATGGAASGTSFTYTYDDAAGVGVDIYVIDTGIRTTHTDFGGRARWGATFGGYANADGHGHGTHCAGTAAGTRWGVAKRANLIAVKAFSDAGGGTVSDTISALDWVVSQSRASGRPSVISMSVRFPFSSALNNAITTTVNGGIHVVVAAGNDGNNASNWSPASAAAALTVGASTITDSWASFSNFGSVVDLVAPGVDVTSAWGTSNTATNRISGTSMATPHVAGLVAYTISVNGNASPASITSTLKSQAVNGVLSGVPSGTANALARNNV